MSELIGPQEDSEVVPEETLSREHTNEAITKELTTNENTLATILSYEGINAHSITFRAPATMVSKSQIVINDENQSTSSQKSENEGDDALSSLLLLLKSTSKQSQNV